MTDLFGHQKVRAKPRKLMHAIDAGQFPDGKSAAHFKCSHCGHDDDWSYASICEAKRGIPCPKCEKING